MGEWIGLGWVGMRAWAGLGWVAEGLGGGMGWDGMNGMGGHWNELEGEEGILHSAFSDAIVYLHPLYL